MFKIPIMMDEVWSTQQIEFARPCSLVILETNHLLKYSEKMNSKMAVCNVRVFRTEY